MKKLLLIIFICIGYNVSATHLVGGNMAYEYLGDTDGDGDFNYRIKFQTFLDCNSPFWLTGFPQSVLEIGVYEGVAIPSGNLPQTTTVQLFLIDSNSIVPTPTNGCNIGQTVCLYQATYEAEVDLPISFAGYHLFYDRCCRTPAVINLTNPGNQGLAFHAFIPPTLVNNNSPVFSDVPVPFLCVGDTSSILNTAIDPDGDLLIFSFVDPYKGFGSSGNAVPGLPNSLSWPIPTVDWVNGAHDENNPFGPTGYAFMDGATGLTEYMAPNFGNYVVAVEVREFRFGNLIGITRRDMQFIVINCPPNPPPNLAATNGSGTTTYTIQECDSLSFPITFTDQDGDSLFLSNNGDLFNTSIVNPSATIDPVVQGDSTVTTTFNWQTGCGSSQALPYLFTTSVTDDGCPSKTTNIVYEITVEPTEIPDSIIGSPIVCENSTETYSVDTINGFTFNWNVTGGNIVSGQGSTTVNVNWGNIGAGVVAVSGVSSCGCPSTIIDTSITILNAPITDAGIDFTICVGDSVQIGGAPTGTTGTTISWSPNNNITDTIIGNPFVFPTNSQDYIVTVDNGACVAKDTVSITVNSLPIIDAGLPQTICNSGTVSLGGSPTGPAGSTYNWTPSGTLNNGALANPTATLSTTTTYVVSVTNVNLCTDTGSVTITVNPPLTPTFSIDTSICIGDGINPLSTTSNNGITGSWSPSPNNMTTTTYTFTPTPGQCATPTTLTITVNPIVTPTFNNVASVCVGDVISPLPTTSLNGINGSWSPTLNNTTTTTYTFTPNAGECATTTVLSITVNTPTTPTFNTVASVCVGDVINPLPTTSLNGINGSWSPALNNMITTTYTFTPTTGQCATTTTLDVTVNPLPLIDAGLNEEICTGSSIQLNATGGASYTWSPLINIINPQTASPTVSPASNTTYVVLGTDANQCSNADSVTVNVFSIPSINDTTICIGNELQLNAVGPLNALYIWSPSTGLSNPNIANPITTTMASITYDVTVQDANGCIATESLFIEAETKPTVAFDFNIKPGCDGILVEYINLSSGGNEYLWEFGDGEQSLETDPTHYFIYGANFETSLEVSSINECTSTSDSLINSGTFEEKFNVIPPSVFSPNNDGINDVFQIDIPEEMASCVSLQIFNRWGSKIFESEGQNVAWDGRTTAAKKVPVGTYFYVLEINGILKKGSLTLLE
ncbi:MAG: gliding motility-associated C-terminal domain-containing protein [Vicingaceae bacterium]|nr:gliding motility-associated C-terminal domain-containing protein [Vicingaceae bacterium]